MQNEVSGRLDVFAPGYAIRASELISKHERQADLIHLQPAADRTSIDPRVLRKAAIAFLLHSQEVVEQSICSSTIAHRVKRRGDVIQVARPNAMITTDRRFIRVRPTTPGR